MKKVKFAARTFWPFVADVLEFFGKNVSQKNFKVLQKLSNLLKVLTEYLAF